VPPGLGGQFLLGVLLGAVWTPCTGPTLAGAIALASRSESLGHAGAVMAIFSIGAAVPVLALAYASRVTLQRRQSWAGVFTVGKSIVGALLLLVGVLTLTGADKRIEAWMVERMPPWLLQLTTAL
jgi:cytochrome c-type biogenesis protein